MATVRNVRLSKIQNVYSFLRDIEFSKILILTGSVAPYDTVQNFIVTA